MSVKAVEPLGFKAYKDAKQILIEGGETRITLYEGQADFTSTHDVGEYKVNFMFRGAILDHCVDFVINRASDSVTEQFFGDHPKMIGQGLIGITAEEAVSAYFEFLEMLGITPPAVVS